MDLRLGGVGLGGHASGLLEESLDVHAPPDGFTGVATPVSPPLEIRCVYLGPEEVNVVIVNNGLIRNEKEVVLKLRRNREIRVEGVVLVPRGVIGVAIDTFLLFLPSLGLLVGFCVIAWVLLLVVGIFLLLVVARTGGRMIVLERLGWRWFVRGRPLGDESLKGLGHSIKGRTHAGFRLLDHGAHLIPAGGSVGAPAARIQRLRPAWCS